MNSIKSLITGMSLFLAATLAAEDTELERDLVSIATPKVKVQEDDEGADLDAASRGFRETLRRQQKADMEINERHALQYKELMSRHQSAVDGLNKLLTSESFNEKVAMVFLRELERGSSRETAAVNIETTQMNQNQLRLELEKRLTHEEESVSFYQSRLAEVSQKLAELKEAQKRREAEAEVLGEGGSGFGFGVTTGNKYATKIDERRNRAYDQAKSQADQIIEERAFKLLKSIDLTIPDSFGSSKNPQHPLQQLLSSFSN